MSDQTKKKWRVNPRAALVVESDERSICTTGGYSSSCDDNVSGHNTELARHIVAIHNAIVRAGIDWRALERSPNALKTMIRLYVSAINQIEGHVSVELDRDLLKALGVKP